jgi:putative kinase
MQEFELSVDGLKVKAAYDSATIDGVLTPLVKRWSNLARGLGRRMIVFMAGAPGTGKSCCAQTLEELSLSVEGALPLTAVSLDGFHYPNSYLRSNVADVDGREVRLSDIKGAPETFDLNAFRAKLIELKRGKRVLMPAYSRKTHEVEENAIAVDTRIVLIEGNYLLLDERGWRGLCAYCNDSVFIEGHALRAQGTPH